MRTVTAFLALALASCLVASCGKKAPETPEEQAKAEAQMKSCLSNVKMVSMGLLMFCQDYGERFPQAGADFEKTLMPYIKNEGVFSCPTDEDGHSYAINSALAGKSLAEVASPAQTVAIFESDDGRTVAYRHDGGASIGFVDGHCKTLTKQEVERLRWSP